MSTYFIRYCARIRSDGATWITTGTTKTELSYLVDMERRECKSHRVHFEVEERFPAIYHKDKAGVVLWKADCTDLRFARKLLKLLNGE